MSNAAAAILFAGVVAYSVFAGADFGAGLWDLTAGGAERGRPTRDLIDHSIGPVWEANHVWLIFCLVVLWSSFPSAFAAIMTTLYIPLGLAALGIVLRGSGFAFRKATTATSAQRASGIAFASSSVVTPFFLGTVAGGVASGRVPSSGQGGDAITSWLNPTSVLGGTLAVVTCAYLAAVFLHAEARLAGLAHLERSFRCRAFASATAAGGIALAGVGVLHSDAPRLFSRLVGPASPLVAVAGLAGLAALVTLSRSAPRTTRLLAATAVATVVAGWGVGQYPYVLGTHLTVREAAAPSATLWAVVAVFGAALLLCVPSLIFLYALQQRGELDTG